MARWHGACTRREPIYWIRGRIVAAGSMNKDETMTNYKRWTQALAMGILLAAPAAWADESDAESRETSREQARAANEDAARDAAEAVKAATRLDLDIRLIGPTSLKVAGKT